MTDCTFVKRLILLTTLLSAARPQQTSLPLLPDTTLHDGNVSVFTYAELGMTIVSVPEAFDYVYVPKDPDPVRVIGERQHYRYLVNASFFHGERLNALHAGWLRLGGKVLAPLMEDNQLTHVVRYERESGRVRCIPYGRFSAASDTTSVEFQTGPLVIDSSRVAARYIRTSVNGLGKYTRTLLATVDERQSYFVTVRKRVALDSLAGVLLRLNILNKGRLDVVNLDGGLSVAFYSSSHPELNYNETARLPLLLGIP